MEFKTTAIKYIYMEFALYYLTNVISYKIKLCFMKL
jgi:hypothetical protein